jgi:hypothetical protein
MKLFMLFIVLTVLYDLKGLPFMDCCVIVISLKNEIFVEYCLRIG